MMLMINGQPFHTPEDCSSMADLLALPQWRRAMVIVELNGAVLNSRQYDGTALTEGDCIEMVQVVGGG
ncbi:sulfur carrier protein ThiS [Paenibacillus mesotrionivorans]|jgi:sulfur carrier protein|uniref:Sulfur carrier protein ThiS n=1 Tax=Paenibacillus mesotrionivorans TaxID=3160968 RepID=A0ACC7P156_9BACL